MPPQSFLYDSPPAHKETTGRGHNRLERVHGVSSQLLRQCAHTINAQARTHLRALRARTRSEDVRCRQRGSQVAKWGAELGGDARHCLGRGVRFLFSMVMFMPRVLWAGDALRSLLLGPRMRPLVQKRVRVNMCKRSTEGTIEREEEHCHGHWRAGHDTHTHDTHTHTQELLLSYMRPELDGHGEALSLPQYLQVSLFEVCAQSKAPPKTQAGVASALNHHT